MIYLVHTYLCVRIVPHRTHIDFCMQHRMHIYLCVCVLTHSLFATQRCGVPRSVMVVPIAVHRHVSQSVDYGLLSETSNIEKMVAARRNLCHSAGCAALRFTDMSFDSCHCHCPSGSVSLRLAPALLVFPTHSALISCDNTRKES